MPIIQPDPRYFDFGGAFANGMQQSRENQRQNAMLDLDKQRVGMDQQRMGMEQDQARREKAMQGMSVGLAAAVKSGSPAEFVRQHGQPFSQGFQELGFPMDLSTLDDNQVLSLAEKFGAYKPEPEKTTWKDASRPWGEGGALVYGQENNAGEFQPFEPKGAGGSGSERSPYFTPVYTGEGVFSFNNRTGGMASPEVTGGKGVLKTSDDPTVRANVAGSEKYAQLTSEKQVAVEQKLANMRTSDEALDAALPLIRSSTGSVAGNVADKALAVFGVSLEGADAIAALQVISAGLVANVPRMEGPQSNKDVEMYKEAAGDIGNANKPISQRLAAVRTIRNITNKYRALNPNGWNPGGSASGDPVMDAIAAEKARRAGGQ